MYLRFQTKMPDPQSGHPTGILVAAHTLRESDSLSKEDEAWLRGHLAYFNMHLKIPGCLKEHKSRRGISWFRETSGMLDRVWELAAFMEEQGIFIDMVKTNDPGIIYYQDGHQVVAKMKKPLRR
jgi:hypothetical protein